MGYSKLKLLSDTHVADFLSMSKSWVRKERFNRRHGLHHALDIDPIYVGSSPRYRFEDVVAWIEKQNPKFQGQSLQSQESPPTSTDLPLKAKAAPIGPLTEVNTSDQEDLLRIPVFLERTFEGT